MVREVVDMHKCEFCERKFQKGSYERTLRGKKHIFCSASCFVLHHYRVPKFDMDKMYEETTASIPADLSEQIMKEVRE